MSIKCILINLFSADNVNEPVRLQKQPIKTDYLELLNTFIERNFYIIALVIMVLSLICFVWVCTTIVGVSATDSGNLYNHIQEVI